MSKAVLMSIQPKWCELIANGKKTVEVRKTKPKLETPFKVYIYCTDPRHYVDKYHCYSFPKNPLWLTKNGVKTSIGSTDEDPIILNGKVIGEFVCDEIYDIGYSPYNHGGFISDTDNLYEKSCLDLGKMFDYLSQGYGYGWHISNLVIYDKPKELGVFQKYGALSYDDWLYGIYNGTSESDYENYLKPFKVVHAPQSWCYVEEWIP